MNKLHEFEEIKMLDATQNPGMTPRE